MDGFMMMLKSMGVPVDKLSAIADQVPEWVAESKVIRRQFDELRDKQDMLLDAVLRIENKIDAGADYCPTTSVLIDADGNAQVIQQTDLIEVRKG